MADIHGLPTKAHCPKCGSSSCKISSFVEEDSGHLRMYVKCTACEFNGNISAEETDEHLKILARAICEKFGIESPI